MAVFPRPTQQKAGPVNLNILPGELRTHAATVAEVLLLLVLAVGALMLLSVVQLKGRVSADQARSETQLEQAQRSITELSSTEGVQLRKTLKEAQGRLQGTISDFDEIAGRRVRWSMIVRALQSHPQIRAGSIMQ